MTNTKSEDINAFNEWKAGKDAEDNKVRSRSFLLPIVLVVNAKKEDAENVAANILAQVVKETKKWAAETHIKEKIEVKVLIQTGMDIQMGVEIGEDVLAVAELPEPK